MPTPDVPQPNITPPAPAPFELGICMAGAISAGAYTAGVVDFLTQAFDEWERLRGTDGVPTHRVVLKGMSGASAGSMTAAVFAATASHEIPPVPVTKPRLGAPTANRLYEAWVDRADIADLLQTNDRAFCWPPGSGTKVPLRSLLDSSLLDQLARDVFQPAAGAQAVARPWIDPQFHLFLSLANLRGVPYAIGMTGNNGADHIMSLHLDYAPYVRAATATPGSVAVPVDPAKPGQGAWPDLAQAALSSGAFPLFLAPRKISQGDALNFYQWMPGIAGAKPAWTPGITASIQATPGQFYDFWTVDGGTLSNEPLDLIRHHLFGSLPPAVAASAPAADRLMLLIDPFVGFDAGAYANNTATHPTLLSLVGATFSAMKMQARFKPGELLLAAHEHDFSRYLIAPVRTKTSEGAKITITDVTAIACGVLGGFGGFLDHEFRRHDYHLGRRNAQQFLRKHFALEIQAQDESLHNPRFACSDAEAIRKGDLWRASHPEADGWSPWHFTEKVEVEKDTWVTRHYRPIVPLVGTADSAQPVVDWPRYTHEMLDTLEDQISTRVEFVGDQLASSMRFPASWAAWVALRIGRGFAVSAIKEKISAALVAHDRLLR